MPSLSINSKDLDSLGLNLKDLLKAISQTKSSPDEVIKIKKRKKKVRNFKSNKGLPKAPSMNPFPQTNPRFTQYPQIGGGGSGFPIMTRVEVRNPDPQTQQQRQDELARQQQQQLLAIQNQAQQQLQANQQQLQRFQTQTNRNLRQIQNQGQQIHNQTIQQLNDNDRTQRENRRLLGYVADVAQRFTNPGQNRPPPPNLDNADGNTLIRNTPPQPDRTDRFGIVTPNDPMLVMRTGEMIETPAPEYPVVYPEIDTQTTTEENPMTNEFDRLTQTNEVIDQTNDQWEDIPEDLPLIEDTLPQQEDVMSSSVDTRVTKRTRGRPKIEKQPKMKGPVGRPKKISLPAKVSIVDMMKERGEQPARNIDPTEPDIPDLVFDGYEE